MIGDPIEPNHPTFRPIVDTLLLRLPPRYSVPSVLRDGFAAECTADKLHDDHCSIHALIDLGSSPGKPTGPGFTMAPNTDHPLHEIITAATDAFTLISQRQLLLVGSSLNQQQRIALFDSISDTVARCLYYTPTERTDLIPLHIPIILGMKAVELSIKNGLCSCRKLCGRPASEPVEKERIFAIDPAKILPTINDNPQGLGPGKEGYLPFLVPMDEYLDVHTEYIDTLSSAAVNLYRNSLFQNQPLPVRPYDRETVLEFYDDPAQSLQPHVPISGQHQRALVEIFAGYSTPSSVARVQDLDQMSITELHYPKRHDGKVLMVRVLTDLRVIGTGVKFVVEDAKGKALPCFVEVPLPRPAMTYPSSFLCHLYPVGTILAIKEPFVRLAPLPGRPEICVSVPSDVEELEGEAAARWEGHGSATINDPQQLKDKGNEALVKLKNPSLAIIFYTRALLAARLETQLKLALLLNRAQAGISGNRPGLAWRDCLTIDGLAAGPEGLKLSLAEKQKLLHRKMKAAQGLGHVEAALRFATDAVNLEIKDAKRTRDAIARQRESQKKGRRLEDWGSLAEIRSSKGRGEGVFAIQKIKAGTLVLAAPATLTAYLNEQCQYEFSDRPTWDQGKLRTTANVIAICKAVHEMLDNPLFYEKIARLHPQIAQAENMNLVDIDRPTFSQRVIDVDLIRTKFSSNASWLSETEQGQPRLDYLGRACQGTKVNMGYSKLNHSCVPNTFISGDNDITEIRVTRDLEPGDELFTSYWSENMLQMRLGDRQATSKFLWGFICHCPLCDLDEKDKSDVRWDLFHNLWPRVQQKRWEDMEAFSKKLDATYAVGRVLKPQLSTVYWGMAKALSADRRAAPAQVLELINKSWEADGWIICTPKESKDLGRSVRGLRYGKTWDAALPRMCELADVLGALNTRRASRAELDAIQCWRATPMWVATRVLGGMA
ncbi:hypothetical protein P7C73_g3545, partial [Tremellales sp. Uapishka_1]